MWSRLKLELKETFGKNSKCVVTSSVSYLFSFMPALFCFRILISSGRVVRSKNKTNLLNINYGDAIFTYGNVNFVWFRCFVMILSDFKVLFIIPGFINTKLFARSTAFFKV